MFLRKIWPDLDEDYQIHQNTVLQVLQGKVTSATTLVDSIIGIPEVAFTTNPRSRKSDAKRAKYALWAKSSINSALKELKEWSEVFDMSWILITLQPGTAIDDQLEPVESSDDSSLSTLKELRQAINSTVGGPADSQQPSLFLSPDMFDDSVTKIACSPIELRRGADDHSYYFIDQPTETQSLAEVCKLAKRLRNVESLQFGVLRCLGILKHSPASQTHIGTQLVFSLPASSFTEPHSLRKMELAGMETYPLDERFILARQLAKAVMFVHSAEFVHKNIRPESILVVRNDAADPVLLLVGFKHFRLEAGRTILRGDEDWEANIYRHPTRQGVQPAETYVMQHDIYALGVCLLEIGIGSSFVLYDDKTIPAVSPILANLLDVSIKDRRRRAFELKRGLIKLAKESLPTKMGRRYTEIVVMCLTCLDQTENSFGLETDLLDENGLLVGVRFIETVSTRHICKQSASNSSRS